MSFPLTLRVVHWIGGLFAGRSTTAKIVLWIGFLVFGWALAFCALVVTLVADGLGQVTATSAMGLPARLAVGTGVMIVLLAVISVLSPTPVPTGSGTGGTAQAIQSPELARTAAPTASATPPRSPEPTPTPTQPPTPAPTWDTSTFTVTSPASGTTVGTDLVVVTGTGPAGARIILDVPMALDEEVTVAADGTWSMSVLLGEGDNSLALRVEDIAASSISLDVAYVPAPVDAFKAFTLKGRGSRVVKFTIPEDAIAIAQITEKGTSNFAVWTIAADGSSNQLLVNEIGSYKGTRLFDTGSDEHSVAFKIESNGSWTITVRPVTQAKAWDPSTVSKGTGSMVLRVAPASDGFVVIGVTHRGSSNFAVWSYTADSRDLLFNEIGRYSGESVLPDGTLLLEIEADGAWTVTPG